MKLFHFSEDAEIPIFHPRPLRIPVDRGADRAWLNGPLVWASHEAFSLLYLFPRECPRIVLWPTEHTTPQDREEWFRSSAKAVVYVEDEWLPCLKTTAIYRYSMPTETFEDIDDVGM